MKVLVISHMYPSSFNNVKGIFVHKQVQSLQEQGCEVKVVSPVPSSPLPLSIIKKKWKAYADIPHRAMIDGVEVFYPRYIEFPRSFLLAYSGYFMYMGIYMFIRELYDDFKFDIIHSHVAIPDGYAAMLLSRKLKVPYIVTIHGQDFHFTINKSIRCRENLFKVLDGSNEIVTVSSKLRNILKDHECFTKAVVVNNGFDIRDCAADELTIDNRMNKVILSVSSLIESKGIDINIRAVSKLMGKYPDIKYYIVGEGPEDKRLIELIKDLNLSDNVIFTGRLPYNEVMKYMANADVFSLPSWEEGFGMVYIEAMAHGKPVIGVRGEGISDVIENGENGFLVAPKNVDEVAETMDYIFTHPKESKLSGQKGRQTVFEGFTWQQNALKNIEIYNRIIRSC